MAALRILIADDHAAVRRGIRALLESHAQWEVCGEATNGKEAVQMATRLRPDVVVLDVSMPQMNGLDAARRIRRAAPDARVLILTMHEANQLAAEVRRAGGDRLVRKSNAHQSLIRAIESLCSPVTPIHLAGSIVGKIRHVGAFFHSAEDRYEVLSSFIAEGLAHGQKALHIIDPTERDRHVTHLRQKDIDAKGAEAQGQLVILPWEEGPLHGGEFDQRAMRVRILDLLDKGFADGFPLTRAIAHMEWALEDRPGVADLIEYEARLNDVLADSSDVLICAYDLSKFSGSIIIDAIRTHPVVVIAGRLQTNPFYAPPDLMIEELGNRAARRREQQA
jgi:DNA-binding NarL/FixJ family response regulator